MVFPHLRRSKIWLVVVVARDQARRTAGKPITPIPTYPDEP